MAEDGCSKALAAALACKLAPLPYAINNGNLDVLPQELFGRLLIVGCIKYLLPTHSTNSLLIGAALTIQGFLVQCRLTSLAS